MAVKVEIYQICCRQLPAKLIIIHQTTRRNLSLLSIYQSALVNILEAVKAVESGYNDIGLHDTSPRQIFCGTN